jgi:hypothetical protein
VEEEIKKEIIKKIELKAIAFLKYGRDNYVRRALKRIKAEKKSKD